VLTRRLGAFALVGAVGFVAQLGTFALLASAFGWPLLLATAASVAVAVVHNFVWHERWTFRDGTGSHCGWPARLMAFSAANGLVSLTGNVGFMAAYKVGLGLAPFMATCLAVASTSVLNFTLADRFVFKRES
jgi:putative flippase GtrA